MDLFVGKHVPEEGGVVTLVELSRRSEVLQGGADRDEAGPVSLAQSSSVSIMFASVVFVVRNTQ